MKFLGRAKKILRGISEPSKPRVQYFNVRCPSGHRIRGERTLGYQALRCPGCGEGIFVLPASPLPEPLAPRREASPRAVATTPAAIEEPIGLVDVPMSAEFSPEHGEGSRALDAEIIWDEADAEADKPDITKSQLDEPKPEAIVKPTPRVQRPKLAAKGADESESRARDSGSKARVGPDRRVAEPRQPIPNELRGRWWSRHRPALIFLAVAFLVLGTFGLRVWRSRRQELPGIYELGRSEGIPALEAGKFDKAHQLLSQARAAVDSLGGALDGAEEVRQAAGEAGIFVDLLPETLEDLIGEARRMDPQGWENRFKAFYAGRSVVIDARITAAPSPDGKGQYAIDYLVFPPGGPSQFRANGASEWESVGRFDLSDFELLQLAGSKVGDHVVFGAKLASFEFSSERDNRWSIRFQPKSGVFITHVKSLESLGWPAESMPAETSAGEE